MGMVGNYLRVDPEQLATLQRNPDSLPELVDGDAAVYEGMDVDKAWHAIHYLLNGDACGSEGPLANVVLGGEPLGEEDFGYGPARFLTPDEVQATAGALASLDLAAVLGRYDAQRLNGEEIYFGSWTDSDEDREYIRSYLDGVVNYFALAAKNGQAMLVYIM